MNKKSSKTLRSKIIIMYVFMTILNITLLTLIISDNQVEIMTENASYKAKEMLLSISRKLKEYTSGLSGKKETPAVSEEEKLKLLDSLLLTVTQNYLISDLNGKIIHQSVSNISIPGNFVENLRKSVADQEFSGAEYFLTVDKNSDYIHYYYPLTQIGYNNRVLYASYDLKGIRGKYDKLFKTIIIMLIAVVVFHLFMAFYNYRQIIAPIFRLSKGTREIADGNYDTRIQLKRNDEIGELADGFNIMAAQISKEVVELKDMVEQVNGYNKRMKFELNIAQKIQECIIPKNFPESGVLQLSGAYIPMEDLGGDFYDIYKISDSKLALVIADVSGHGIPASLITMMAKISFGNQSKDGCTAGEILNKVNRELCGALADAEVDSYLTVFYGIIDLGKKELEYANAGHNDIFVVTKDKEVKTLSSQSPILGKMEGIEYSCDTIRLSPGDKLVLYTDGIPEARNGEKEFFTVEKFTELLLGNQHLGAAELVKKVISEVYSFLGDSPPVDDMTILIADITHAVPEVKMELGAYFEKLSRMYQEAIEYFQKNEFEKSRDMLIELFQKFKRKDDNFKVAYLLGQTYFKLDNYPEALKTWEGALQINPGSTEVQKKIAILRKLIK